MTDTMIKYLCSTCKGKCERSVVIVENKDCMELRCYDYVPDESKIKGYEKPLGVTAKRKYVVDIDK